MTDRGMSARPTVHIVDADIAVRESLRTLLELYAYEVRTYGEAEELLANGLGAPGCVITEAHLPGMSGLELLERLRATAADVPVIVIAAQGGVPLAVRALRAGAADFLEKPFVEFVLLSHLRELLQPRRVSGPSSA